MCCRHERLHAVRTRLIRVGARAPRVVAIASFLLPQPNCIEKPVAKMVEDTAWTSKLVWSSVRATASVCNNVLAISEALSIPPSKMSKWMDCDGLRGLEFRSRPPRPGAERARALPRSSAGPGPPCTRYTSLPPRHCLSQSSTSPRKPSQLEAGGQRAKNI